MNRKVWQAVSLWCSGKGGDQVSALYKPRTLHRVIVSLCAFLVALSLCLPYAHAAAPASEANAQPVRIAIPVSSIAADYGTASGYMDYTLEYLHAITQYTDWTYEIISVPGSYESGLSEAFEMLRDGTADIIAPLKYREDAGEGIYFSRGSYATASVILQIPNKVFEGTDFGTEIRVAVLAKSNTKPYADEYFEKNHMEPQYLECRSVDEQIQAVCSGEADVMLNSNLEYIPDMTVVAEFSPQTLYFASDDQQLLKELDDALSYIHQANPMFVSQLYEKHFMDTEQELTLEETRFIQQSEPYVVAVMDGQPPYQYQDPDTGEFRGIAVDLLRRIAQDTGLEFTFLAVASWDDIPDLIRDGKIQIIAGMPCDFNFALERDLTISRSYASAPYMLVSKTGFSGVGKGKLLALSEITTYTEGNYAGDVVRFRTMGDCIEAVRTGEADYTYVDLYTAQYYLRNVSHSSLQMTSQAYTPRSVCFGLVKPTEHELLNILNKEINQISDADMQNITSQNVNQFREVTLADLIFWYPVESMLVLGAVGLVIIGLLLFLFLKKARLSRTLRRKAMEDGLTTLYNSAACRKLVMNKLRDMETDQLGAFLLMDIDDFKEVNDRYGHQTGDRILCQFSELLKEALPEDSIIARIGGDEFVVYLESVRSEAEIAAVCDRLREASHVIFVGKEHITISVGAATAHKDDDYDTLYHLADKHMYEVKRNQKGRFSQTRSEIFSASRPS